MDTIPKIIFIGSCENRRAIPETKNNIAMIVIPKGLLMLFGNNSKSIVH
jgi:hypothetical protein